MADSLTRLVQVGQQLSQIHFDDGCVCCGMIDFEQNGRCTDAENLGVKTVGVLEFFSLSEIQSLAGTAIVENCFVAISTNDRSD